MKTIRSSVFERGLGSFSSTSALPGDVPNSLDDYVTDGLCLTSMDHIAVDSVFLPDAIDDDDIEAGSSAPQTVDDMNSSVVGAGCSDDGMATASDATAPTEDTRTEISHNVTADDSEGLAMIQTDPGIKAETDDCIVEFGTTDGCIKDITPTSSETGRPLRSCRNYNFRTSSITKRIETESTCAPTKAKSSKSHKLKAPPLSKYRRKTANTRERERMQEVNDAFDKLRHCIPNTNAMQKLTKITTLKLALNYIDNLQQLLGYSDEDYRPRLLSTDGGGQSDGFGSCSSDAGSMSPVHSPPVLSPPTPMEALSPQKWPGS